MSIVSSTTEESHFDTPRLLHLYDGEGPPLERGGPKGRGVYRENSCFFSKLFQTINKRGPWTLPKFFNFPVTPGPAQCLLYHEDALYYLSHRSKQNRGKPRGSLFSPLTEWI
jgi:hypothetical protein